jgi:hypothetical protein
MKGIPWGLVFGLGFGALLIWIGIAVIVSAPKEVGLGVALIAIGLVICAWAYVRFRARVATTTSGFRDVLQLDLGMSEFGEVSGTRFVSIPFPDQAPPGGAFVLAVLLQNTFTTPRSVRMKHRTKDIFELDEPPDVTLAGGECGLLVLSARVAASARAGEFAVTSVPKVERPGKAGRRAFAVKRAFLPGTVPLRQWFFTVAAAERSLARPLPTPGYTRLFRPGDTAPVDVSVLAFFNDGLR